MHCGSEAETEEGKGQMLVGLMLPTGSTAPTSFTITPGPGATAMTASPEVGAPFTRLLTREAKLN